MKNQIKKPHTTNLIPVPAKKPKKAPKADLNALFLSFPSCINSPINAPKKGPKIIPNGPIKRPTIRPIVAPQEPAFVPPVFFVK